MSLGMMFYKTDIHSRRSPHAELRESRKSDVHNNVGATGVRSFGLRATVALCLLALVLWSVREVHAADARLATSGASPSSASCHATGTAVVADSQGFLENTGDSPTKVTCLVDVYPGIAVTEASIAFRNRSATAASSRCTWYSRPADGGQARGVSLVYEGTEARRLSFPNLTASPLDYRYVECSIAPGVAVGGLTVNTHGHDDVIDPREIVKRAGVLTSARPSWINQQP